MERRALLAAVLCLAVLVAYQEALRFFYPQATEPSDQGRTVPASPAAKGPVREPVPSPAPPEVAATSDAEPPPPIGATIEVETDLYTARIATNGGRLVGFRLKKYRTSIDEASGPLEMVEVAPGTPLPLGVRLIAEDGKFEDDTRVNYVPDRTAVRLSGPESAALTLTGTLASGLAIQKVIRMQGDAYPIEVALRARGAPSRPTRLGLAWRRHVTEAQRGDPEAHYRGALVLAGQKVVHELDSSLVSEPLKAFDSPVGWAGYGDHYFLAALVPEHPDQARAVVSSDATGVQVLLSSPLDPTQGDGTRFVVYIGPKDVEVLQGAGRQLARAVDFGWFSFLAIPLLRLLKLFNFATGNYGVDIILLTILVKVLFVPLSNKSMKSMRDMQRLQPQMAKLREKFKDDRERLNKEMIELYRRHRVNPLGGCLPMLLQFPVFIGLYQTLNQAIELRHAGFALWVRDLSAHECYPWPGQMATGGCNELSLLGLPIPLLVLLMGASMILQQWISPSTGVDPTQQRMMMILMPVMFTIMFVNFPSGLVLYWLVNNVLTIAQQWWAYRERA